MIKIIKYPLYLAPAYRPIIFDIDSDVSLLTHPELQIRAFLYIKKGVIYEQVAIKYQTKIPSLSVFRFNFASQLKSFVSYDTFQSLANELITPNLKSVVAYYVIFQEMANNAQGLMQGFDAIYTSTHWATNATLQHNQIQNLDKWTIRMWAQAPLQSYYSCSIDSLGNPKPPLGNQ